MKILYKIISIILQPILLPTYGILLLIQIPVFANLPMQWKAIAVGGTFLFTALLPSIPVVIMYFRKEVSDLFISNREERTLPYLFSFLAYVFWTLFLVRTMHLPMFIGGLGIGSSISILLITFINVKWKISAHLASLGGLAGGIFGICYRYSINPLWLFILILLLAALSAISRVALKAHTPMQTIAGFALGFLCVFLPVLLL
ncbi:MAG TPA: hypothetical protein P5157_00245 [Paludibacteraceae bacterium]|jgi:membrane-associated phospholipid phosphatase|nr:hypothetical protein [Paludibacteraceae bacterium]OPZ03280.1 MAG: PAP2 superfamily protein [Bacteroidetes bacterium ADurb.BinA395]MBP8966582.1 hypothetical protein [Paludibacteraceae bacterium]HOF98559.1 hypothetical protein [Paludibacteraceae bacterium]HON01579.1 hypothetical protein [Paludibacteraceae bacterium]